MCHCELGVTAGAEHRADTRTTVPPAGGSLCTVSEHGFKPSAKYFKGETNLAGRGDGNNLFSEVETKLREGWGRSAF